jgi:predicted O-methyltransferase YrrM
VQRLLAVLAVGRRCAETGTAFGEGAAAIASTAHSLVTVESDAERAQAAAERLRARRNADDAVDGGDRRGQTSVVRTVKL